jgi:putative ABC transport system permease protein
MPFQSLRLAFRSMLKRKIITGINILGLSIGISAALVIYLIVQYDYSFDRFEANRDRIYRVVTHGNGWDNAGLPVPAQRAMGRATGIGESTAIIGMNDGGSKVSVQGRNGKDQRVFKKQEKFIYSDGRYFSIFPRQWLAGGPDRSLNNPHQIVLSESLQRRYFPGFSPDQAVGNTVTVDDSIQMVVSGVVRDLDAKTDFDHEAFLSLSTIPASPGLKDQYNWDDWGSTNSVNQLIIRLAANVKPAGVEHQIAGIFKPHMSGDWKTVPTLQPLEDIHFNGKLEGKVDKSTLVSLTLLAVFILLLGSINFINLSTAQASERAKEIGMRKILGSSKGQLIRRYLSETILLTVIATVFSLLITPLLIKVFGSFLPEGLDASRIWQPHVLLFMVLLTAVVGLLSGIYPALVLTHIRPLAITRNEAVSASGGNRRIWLRKTLTVSQFVIAQVFIIGVLVVNSQIRYAIHKDMGFRKDAIVNFYVPFDFVHPDGKKFVLRNKLRAIPGIGKVSLGGPAPAEGGWMTTIIHYNENNKDITMPVDIRRGDSSYIGLYDIRLVAGQNVLASDSPVQNLINETLATKLGFRHPADAVGHFLKSGSGPDEKGIPIVGVMADFHLTSVRKEIHPMIFAYDSKDGYLMHVALDPASPDGWPGTIAKMKQAWTDIYPDQAFDYDFLDKTIEGFYKQDQQASQLLTWAAAVAILISCLGLLGLIIFTANQRTKEIGIRKVLGASVAQIIALLSKDFVRLVALAFIIAVPITWYGAHQWLQNFAYHTGLQWWVFGIGGVAMLAIALLILSVRAGKAALANPVKSLRTE